MWIDGLSVHDKKTGMTGNGRRLVVLLQRHLLGKKVHAPDSVDRAKSGIKHSILADGKGIPSVSIDGANIHYMKTTKCALQNVVINKKQNQQSN